MKPTTADSGQSALRIMATATKNSAPFSLLLLDSNMPEMDGFSLVEEIRRHPDFSGITMMMLTSSGQRGDTTRCRELGIAAYLVKPIKQSSLLDTITTVLGKIEQETVKHPDSTCRSSTGEPQHLRILLAEDNQINQKIAVMMLEKRGHTVTVKGNGKEVIALLHDPAAQPFDVILMDVQMPEMDGFEATRIIRDKEKITGAHIPILALTANAMKEDREICLKAGMDGYAAKPLRSAELLSAIIGVLLKPGA